MLLVFEYYQYDCRCAILSTITVAAQAYTGGARAVYATCTP